MPTSKQIPLFKVYMSKKAPKAVSNVLKSGFIGEGPQVKEFERELRQFFQLRDYQTDIITTNSATSAEHLFYHYLKSKRDLKSEFGWGWSTKKWLPFDRDKDEVLTTALTCTATNWPIILNEMKLRWVDVDPLSLNMDLNDLKKKINQNTRIISVVHWGGNPIDVDKLEKIVRQAEKKYNTSILVIEDCALAFGSQYKGKLVGTTGNFATFSLQAIKHITSVDGGFIISPYTSFTRDAKLLRWYGIDREGPRADFRCEADVPEAGFKFHMNDVSAAVGRANLAESTKILSKNTTNGRFYNKALKNIDGVRVIPQIRGARSAFWLYTMHVERRDDFMKYMAENGVATSRVHERNDNHTCVKQYKADLPQLEEGIKSMICIPVGYWVKKEDREYIVDLIKKGW